MPTPVPTSPWPLLRRSIRRHWRRLVPGYVLLALWQLCETLVPVAIGIVVDRGIESESTSRFITSTLVLVALMSTLAFSYRFGSRFIVRALEEESHLLRTEIAGHVLHPRGARTDQLPGEVLSLATGDAERVGQVVYQLAYTIAALLSVVIVAVYVLQVDLVIGLLILIGVPAVTLVIQVVTPLVAKRSERQQESIATASGLATDLLHGLRPLKGIGGEDVAFGRYRSVSRRAQHDTVAVARSWGYLGGLTTVLSGLLLAAVALVAGQRALDGDLTLGQLIALIGLTQFLAEPIVQLGETSAEFGGAFASDGGWSRGVARKVEIRRAEANAPPNSALVSPSCTMGSARNWVRPMRAMSWPSVRSPSSARCPAT
ncbi:MAG: ABC transporter ATP-binding protein, partial [Actinomycetales bacterium]